jgi:hypothetical protein
MIAHDDHEDGLKCVISKGHRRIIVASIGSAIDLLT